MPSKKRRLSETADEPVQNGGSHESSSIYSQVQEFRERLLADEPIEKKHLKQFRRILSDLKDDEASQRKVAQLIDTKLLTKLLTTYTASNNKRDLVIYKILRSFERNLHVNLKLLAPLVFGEKSAANYKQLIQFGQNLHQRMRSDQVLDFFDPKKMWTILLRVDIESQDEGSSEIQLYDARFVAASLFSLIAPGSDITHRKFVESNGLAFAFALTSCRDEDLRAYGYGILQRYLDLLKELSADEFPERPWFKYVIRIFKNSVTETNQRIPHVVAHFLARVSKLMLNQTDPVFGPIMAFFQVKPTMAVDQTPEFYKLFLSSSTENYRAERHWLLKLVKESLIEPHDFKVLDATYGVPLFLSLFASPISDMESRKLILMILKACLQHSSVAMELLNSYSIHSWFIMVLKRPRTSRWEVGFIAELYASLLSRLRENFVEKSTKTKFASTVKRKELIVKIAGRQVLAELAQVEDENKTRWSPTLEKLIQEPWPLENV